MDVIPHSYVLKGSPEPVLNPFEGLEEPYPHNVDFPNWNTRPVEVVGEPRFVKYKVDRGEFVKAKRFAILFDPELAKPTKSREACRLLHVAVEINDYPSGVNPDPTDIEDIKMCHGKGAYSLTCPRHKVLLLTTPR